MKKTTPRRRAAAPDLMGERLVGRCDKALKDAVAQAAEITGLAEGKVVRISVERVVPEILLGRLVYQNGKLVPAALAPTPQPAEALKPTGTQG